LHSISPRIAENRITVWFLNGFDKIVRFATTSHGTLLRSILRRTCAGFCAAYRAVEVILGRLCIVLNAHLRVVAHPLRHYVDRELFQ